MSDDILGKDHLDLVAMSEWADGDKPEDFLDIYEAGSKEHLDNCEKCRFAVVFYKGKRKKTK